MQVPAPEPPVREVWAQAVALTPALRSSCEPAYEVRESARSAHPDAKPPNHPKPLAQENSKFSRSDLLLRGGGDPLGPAPQQAEWCVRVRAVSVAVLVHFACSFGAIRAGVKAAGASTVSLRGNSLTRLPDLALTFLTLDISGNHIAANDFATVQALPLLAAVNASCGWQAWPRSWV